MSIERTAKEILEQQVLLQKGFTFKVRYRKKFLIYKKYGFSFYAKKKLTIKQPTLATLTEIGKSFLEFEMQDELAIENAFKKGIKIADSSAVKVSRIIAIASIGIKDPKFNDSDKEDKEINDLADILYYNINPDILMQICVSVRVIMNVANFTTSISQILDLRNNLPTLIEKKDSKVQPED